MRHLEHAFDVLDTHLPGSLRHDLDVISLALFFHDVRYDPRATNNEEKSAELFRSILSISPDVSRRVTDMIMATRSHETEDLATQFLLDVDLSILGASETEYLSYASGIRREYWFVPDGIYSPARIRVLQRILEKPRIFFFIPKLEVPARRNIQIEIEVLRRV